jgi:hypothetical protein
VLLCAAAVTGWPGHNARFETTELLNVRRFRGYAPRHDGVKHLARLTREHPALVLTNFNTSYVYALTEGDRIVSPFHPINMPTFNKDWFPDTARRAQVREALATGRTVYALLVRRPVERYLPPPAGYEWDEVWRGRGRSLAVLARLVKL